MDSGELLPVGRRVAYWRARRKLSQQMLADRLGKSKSWVDKVERGVRSLDKVSILQDIAAVLRIDTGVLLGQDTQPAGATVRAEGVDRIRAALSTYEVALGRPVARQGVPPTDRLVRGVEYAWTTFQRARYPQLIGLVPDLLAGAQRAHAADDSGSGRAPLVRAYRVTASLLVKLGEAELAWLTADRAMTVATGDPLLTAAVAVQLGQVLCATGRAGLATSTMLAAAYRIAPPDLDNGTLPELSLCGTLLVQAALAAARQGNDQAVASLFDEAADLADQTGDGGDHYRTGFGPSAVALARVVAAVELGDGDEAVAWHEKATARDGWRWLPVEHRAAYLIDIARAYLQLNDPINAGRVLMDAERIAPAEVRHRPAAWDVLAQVARHPAALTTIVPLAAAIGVDGA